MSHALIPHMTADEFLQWEREQDLKWEFDGFQPVAMTGGSLAHSAVCGNLITALNNRLRGMRCRPYGPDAKVQTLAGYRYPDAVMTCSKPRPGADIVAEPVVLFEVLSKSTARTDHVIKLMEYRALPSVQRYILLEQDQAIATIYTRTGHDWVVTQLIDTDTLAMPEIDIEIPMSEFYADLEFPNEP